MANPVRIKRQKEYLNVLLDKADVQGYLTNDDIIEAIPELGKDEERLEAMAVVLRRRGIEFLEETRFDAFRSPSGDEPGLDVEEEFIGIYTDDTMYSSEDTIGLYLKEMAKVPLLNADEELDLARRIENGNKAILELENLNGGTPPERRTELEGIILSGQQAREHLIKANTRLVVSVAKRYNGRGVAFLDLIQEGNLGLIKAVEKYEYWRGFRFSTYATWWIRQTISRAIADQGRTIRVPVHMVDRIRRLYRHMHDMEQKMGHAPTIQEVAEDLKLPLNKVNWMLRVSWLPLSLESPVGDGDDETELGMFVEDEDTPSPMQCAYSRLLSEKIDEMLESLPPREAHILRLRFGLDNGDIYTLEEVGEKFGLTRERIRQIENKALHRLRHPRRARQLKDYL